MRPFLRGVICPTLMLGAVSLFIWAAGEMLHKREPFHTWFYCFAWWSYILFIEAFLCARNGESDLFGAPRRFILLMPLSVAVWLVFEAFNWRLENWHYLKVPTHTGLRWTGYAVSFATVLPGILGTMRLLEHFGIPGKSRSALPKDVRFLCRVLPVLGLACVTLPLLWPRYFFPLIWGAFIFLCEPLNYWLGAPSLLREWEEGSLRRFYALLLGGLWCGLLWEFFNFWAGSKWIYTIPYVGWLKVFEMPLLGFLGFPPFAVECYAMSNSFFAFKGRMEQRMPPDALRRACVLIGVCVTVLCLSAFAGIDHFTVRTFEK